MFNYWFKVKFYIFFFFIYLVHFSLSSFQQIGSPWMREEKKMLIALAIVKKVELNKNFQTNTKDKKKLDEHFQMMIKWERQMTFTCDVQGLRWTFWKEMSTFFSILFSKFFKNITQKKIEINSNQSQLLQSMPQKKNQDWKFERKCQNSPQCLFSTFFIKEKITTNKYLNKFQQIMVL